MTLSRAGFLRLAPGVLGLDLDLDLDLGLDLDLDLDLDLGLGLGLGLCVHSLSAHIQAGCTR